MIRLNKYLVNEAIAVKALDEAKQSSTIDALSMQITKAIKGVRKHINWIDWHNIGYDLIEFMPKIRCCDELFMEVAARPLMVYKLISCEDKDFNILCRDSLTYAPVCYCRKDAKILRVFEMVSGNDIIIDYIRSSASCVYDIHLYYNKDDMDGRKKYAECEFRRLQMIYNKAKQLDSDIPIITVQVISTDDGGQHYCESYLLK